MPSGPKKRKSKRKNMASVSPPHHSWLRSHMQMLKAPSFGNGTKGKEKHNLAEKEAEGNGGRKGEGERVSFLFKGVEAAEAGEMDALESEGNSVSTLSKEGFQSDAGNSLNLDDLKMSALDKSKEGIQETENLGVGELNGGHVVRSEVLEEKSMEEDGTKKGEVDDSIGEVVLSRNEESLPENEIIEKGGAVAEKGEATVVLEVSAGAHEEAKELMEEPQNDDADATTPKTEIPHPPTVVRRVPVWNCCGLLEVFTSFQS